jgi:hypothetical protein
VAALPEWRLLRDGLRDEASRWKEVLRTPREIAPDEAAIIMAALGQQARIVETSDLERRIAALEESHGKP